MPGLRNHKSAEQKVTYLQRLWKKTYLADVIERHNIRNTELLENLADVLCSAVGSLNNPTKLANTIQSVKQMQADRNTVESYIGYLEDAFLFESASSKKYNMRLILLLLTDRRNTIFNQHIGWTMRPNKRKS